MLLVAEMLTGEKKSLSIVHLILELLFFFFNISDFHCKGAPISENLFSECNFLEQDIGKL